MLLFIDEQQTRGKLRSLLPSVGINCTTNHHFWFLSHRRYFLITILLRGVFAVWNKDIAEHVTPWTKEIFYRRYFRCISYTVIIADQCDTPRSTPQQRYIVPHGNKAGSFTCLYLYVYNKINIFYNRLYISTYDSNLILSETTIFNCLNTKSQWKSWARHQITSCGIGIVWPWLKQLHLTLVIGTVCIPSPCTRCIACRGGRHIATTSRWCTGKPWMMMSLSLRTSTGITGPHGQQTVLCLLRKMSAAGDDLQPKNIVRASLLCWQVRLITPVVFLQQGSLC